MDKDYQKAVSSMKEIWHKMDSLYNLYAKSMGINFTAVLVLQLLCDSGVVHTQKEICEKLALPKQLVNSIVKSLWEQGHVKLKEAKDRRNKEIIVTDKGERYILSILKPLEDAESAAWESFSAEEILSYVNTTERYVKAFGDALEGMKKI